MDNALVVYGQCACRVWIMPEQRVYESSNVHTHALSRGGTHHARAACVCTWLDSVLVVVWSVLTTEACGTPAFGASVWGFRV